MKIKPSLYNGVRGLKQLLAPSCVSITEKDEIKVGDYYSKTFVINGYPTSVFLGWLNDLYSYPGDIDIAQHIIPISSKQAINEVTEKIVQYETSRQIDANNGNIKNIITNNSIIDELSHQKYMLVRNLESMFQLNVVYTLYNSDSLKLKKDAQVLNSTLTGKKIGIMPLNYRQDEGIHSTSPFGLNKVSDFNRNINTGALTTAMPFFNPEMSHLNGNFIGINTSLDLPVYIDFFNKNVLNNANLTILGESGSGKTYFCSLLIARSTLNKEKSLIIDPEGEYVKIAEALGGQVFKFNPSRPLGLNIMDISPEVEIDLNGNPTGREILNIKAKASNVLGTLQVMLPDLFNDEVKAILSEIIINLYRDMGFTEDVRSYYCENKTFDEVTGMYREKTIRQMPKLSDLKHSILEYLAVPDNENESLKKFDTAFRLFTKGGAYDLFDCETTLDIDLEHCPIIDFDFSGVEDDILRPVVMQVLMTWTWDSYIKKDVKTKKKIVCDEAWLMLSENIKGSEHTALFLDKCARRIRKYNGSLVSASQNVREFLSRKEGESILSNSSVKCYMSLKPNDIITTADKLQLTEGEAYYLQSICVNSGVDKKRTDEEKARERRNTKGRALLKINNESIKLKSYSFDFEDKLINREYLQK